MHDRAHFITVIILCLILLAGCATKDNDQPDPGSVIKVGVVIPKEGPLWLYGREFLKGLNMAVLECNENGGVKGRKIILQIENNEGDPLKTAQAVKRMASDTTVIAVIGPVISNNALAAATVAQHEKIPMLSPYSSNPALTEIGDFISRICFTDLSQARSLAKYSFLSIGVKKTAILFARNNSYSEGLATYFEREFTAIGGEICIKESYSDEDKTFMPSLQKIFLTKPDALFMPDYYPKAALLLREVAALGKQVTFLGSDGWESLEKTELPKEVINDRFPIYITSHFSPEVILPATQHFVHHYEKRYSSSPNALSALAYDAGMLLIDALKRANQLTRESLKEAINSTRNFYGATGKISINEKRNAVKPVYILEIRGGEFHLRASDVPMQ